MSDWGIHDGLRKILVQHPIDKEEIRSWILKELEYWEKIFSTFNSVNINYLPYLNYYYSKLLDYSQSSHQEQLEKGIDFGNNILEAYKNEIIHHDDPLAKSFQDSISDADSLKSALFSYKSSAFFSDAAYEKLYKNRYQRLIEESESKYQGMLSEMMAKGEETFRAINEYKAAAERQMEASVKNAGANLDVVLAEKEQYLKDVSLKVINNIIANQPVQFWEQKKLLHKKRAITFGWLAAALALIIVIVIGSTLIASQKQTIDLKYFSIPVPDHFSLAIIVLSASFGIWALKIFIKLMISNINMEAEAVERSTMIKTYVSLSETSISEEVTTLFHKSLLATSNSKIEDDTAPDALKAIELILKRK